MSTDDNFFLKWKRKGSTQRLGQFFVNNYVLQGDLPWADLFYCEDDRKSVALIDSYTQALFLRSLMWREIFRDELPEKWESNFIRMIRFELATLRSVKVFMFQVPAEDMVCVLGLEELPETLADYVIPTPPNLGLPYCRRQFILKRKPGESSAHAVNTSGARPVSTQIAACF